MRILSRVSLASLVGGNSGSRRPSYSGGNTLGFLAGTIWAVGSRSDPTATSSDGEDRVDDETAHQSFDLSELKNKSITPFGLPRIELNLPLFDRLSSTLVLANSIINLQDHPLCPV
ncbi:hypothetical protein F3Y22_tig00112285pilonHSYRG00338 [Hibiscus syriacus]|uniref:Uncharacterized protein n=1 Tax=Hibiscus syriacus TaxID=106335 RepID=A0A6A2YA31_HIBSY|nr:hypothetical protein F3Y22_tig00112285pilonHSYRG00338 [Hibiscus syriacus]